MAHVFGYHSCTCVLKNKKNTYLNFHSEACKRGVYPPKIKGGGGAVSPLGTLPTPYATLKYPKGVSIKKLTHPLKLGGLYKMFRTKVYQPISDILTFT